MGKVSEYYRELLENNGPEHPNEMNIWCDGKCDNDRANFHDDGNQKVYIDDYGNEYICSKHHYSCVICDKIVQVG